MFKYYCVFFCAAVLNSEIVKLIICLYAVFLENESVERWAATLKNTIINNFSDTLKVCIPSMVYVVQNNLLYVAASHLDAATYQVPHPSLDIDVLRNILKELIN